MERYVDPDSFLGSIWIIFISTVVFTGVLVYVSTYVAPMGKKAVSIVVATLATAVAVGLFVMSLMAKDYGSTFYSICFAAGACVTSYSIVHGETKMPADLPWTPDPYNPEELHNT
jgi:Na+/melibiose symporter-like transporter